MRRVTTILALLSAAVFFTMSPNVATASDGGSTGNPGAIGNGQPDDPFEAILYVEHFVWDLFGASVHEVCESVFPLPDENGLPVWDVPFYGEDVGGGNAVADVLDHYFE